MADERLIRDRAGAYHSPDGRFSVENSGRWHVRDAKQLDELGLPRVLGPFATLDDARAAIGEARERKVVRLPRAGTRRRSRSG